MKRNPSKVSNEDRANQKYLPKYPKLRPISTTLNEKMSNKPQQQQNHYFTKEQLNDGKLVVYLTGNQIEQLLKQRAVIVSHNENPLRKICH